MTNNATFSNSRALATTLWYPDNLEIIRGVVVFTGGQASGGSGDTRGQADNRFWQRFGESYGFALLGTQFTGSYTDAASGPGMALLDTLAALADKTSHPELAHAPLLLEGFSNGGYFSYTFAHWKPARVIAFCLNKSGFATAPLDEEFLAVPGLLIWGSEEPATGTPTVIHSLVQQGRMQRALWAEAKEWGAKHEEGSVERIYAPYFAELIGLRYPAGADPRTGEIQLYALDEARGWLGDHADASIESNLPTIAGYADYTADKLAASWLPSRDFATLWRGFVTKNPLTLSAPSTGAQLDATKALSLAVTGLADAERASFLDGATPLLEDVAATGGQATGNWSPLWGGVRGIVAIAQASAVTRTSRPAAVALYGKAAPAAPVHVQDAGMPAADGGGSDAAHADAAAPRDAGPTDASTPDAGGPRPARDASSRPAADGGAAPADEPDPDSSDRDAAENRTELDGGGLASRDATPLQGGCSCQLQPGRPMPQLALLSLLLPLVARRRRRS